jgi:hypothetical protein
MEFLREEGRRAEAPMEGGLEWRRVVVGFSSMAGGVEGSRKCMEYNAYYRDGRQLGSCSKVKLYYGYEFQVH